uniref:ATP-dependent RNA helicase n=1 Tax=Petromyzon marinus TaxID=7757 RepID=A0AAJ7U9U6_PETMA|nr:probable ATP-dependent RNA helicase DDX31 isoform X2 [Petromyzon marinus]XP_032832317.1 probable ATP-dependent RNA helicase DDX31 isoform X2 [Petromyzon marinus]
MSAATGRKPDNKKRGAKRSRETDASEEEEAAALRGPAKASRGRGGLGARGSEARGRGKARAGGPGEKAFPKTSSLFKNNPSIPSVERPVVSQCKEAVFAGNAFSTLDLHPYLVSTLDKQMKLTQMTMVQRQAIPVLLQGRDALVKSQTGSGKTLAYAVPLVQALQAARPKITRADGPYALIIVPTRELAMQSFNAVQQLLKPFSWVVPGVLMGGEKRKSEKARLRKGINVLVATPGRLVDHIHHTETLSFARVAHLVLDEADRLLDLGFEKDLTVILNRLEEQSPTHQNVLLSATLNQGVTWLAGILLDDPVSVTVETHGGEVVAATTNGGAHRTGAAVEADEDVEEEEEAVEEEEEQEEANKEVAGKKEGPTKISMPPGLAQHFITVPSKLRLVTLTSFILAKCQDEAKLVVFVSSREAAEFHFTVLGHRLGGGGDDDDDDADEENDDGEGKGPPKVALWRLHGSVDQQERMEVFDSFCKARSGVLVCTDVAARGLDLPRVSWIVQYMAPASVEEYVHRVGRTARIGHRGSSVLFLAPSELEFLTVLAERGISLRELKMESVLRTLLGNSGGRAKRGKWEAAQQRQAAHEKATEMQLQFESFTHSSPEHLQLAKKAYQSYVRAYATYPASLKHVFHVRSLHLGHAAKSFGLREAPGQLAGKQRGAVGRRAAGTRANRPATKAKPKRHTAFKELILSEFASGL